MEYPYLEAIKAMIPQSEIENKVAELINVGRTNNMEIKVIEDDPYIQFIEDDPYKQYIRAVMELYNKEGLIIDTTIEREIFKIVANIMIIKQKRKLDKIKKKYIELLQYRVSLNEHE